MFFTNIKFTWVFSPFYKISYVTDFDLGILTAETALKTSPAITRNPNTTVFQKASTFRNAF